MTGSEIRFVRNPDFIFRKILEETLLVPIFQDVADMDCIYTLNEMGAFLWENMEEPVLQPELETAILEVFEVDAETARKDLEHFLLEMETIGAVKRV